MVDALVAATGQLILERGVRMSVCDIARRACVNHRLVHTYFGSKEALLSAAFGQLVDRAAAELDEAVIVATTLGLGWALFAEHLCGILDVDEDERDAIEQRVLALIADIGGIPNNGTSASSDDRPSD